MTSMMTGWPTCSLDLRGLRFIFRNSSTLVSWRQLSTEFQIHNTSFPSSSFPDASVPTLHRTPKFVCHVSQYLQHRAYCFVRGLKGDYPILTARCSEQSLCFVLQHYLPYSAITSTLSPSRTMASPIPRLRITCEMAGVYFHCEGSMPPLYSRK